MKRLVLSLIFLMLAACSPIAKDYAGMTPEFRLDQFLTGDVVGHGIFFGRSGKVESRFKVEITGTPEEGGLALNETITYVDGKVEKRVWHIKKDSETNYRGLTPDVRGEAVVENHGFAAQWKYNLALHIDDSTYHLDFDDWMFQLDDKVMLNRATATKWGFKVGEVMIAFYKQ